MLSAAVARSLREGTLWVLAALALILLLALLSYHPHDPASRIPASRACGCSNWVGPVGAWLAGFFLFLFGRPAYLFPVMLAYAGWLVHKEQALPDARSRINTLLRAAGFVSHPAHQLRSCDSALERGGAAEQRRRRARRTRRARERARL